jgi:hypothetical protein
LEQVGGSKLDGAELMEAYDVFDRVVSRRTNAPPPTPAGKPAPMRPSVITKQDPAGG